MDWTHVIIAGSGAPGWARHPRKTVPAPVRWTVRWKLKTGKQNEKNENRVHLVSRLTLVHAVPAGNNSVSKSSVNAKARRRQCYSTARRADKVHV